MSSWGDIDISTLSTDPVVLPEGNKYTFKLNKGARFSPFKEGRIDAGATVAEGDYKGTQVYFSYPDPKEQPWVLGVFARMQKALGLKAEAGEDPVTYLNRAAGNLFVAPVKHRNVTVDGVEGKKAEINIGNVTPVPAA
jgi:hypothetical protein